MAPHFGRTGLSGLKQKRPRQSRGRLVGHCATHIMLHCSNIGRKVCAFPDSLRAGTAMIGWMQPKSYARAIVPGPYHLLYPFPEKPSGRRFARAAGRMPDDFSDYCVFVTRHSLMAFTTSLTDISSDAHTFFVKLNYAFAAERMMRSFMLWGMPGAAAATLTPLNVLDSWFPSFKPAQKLLPSFAGQQFLPSTPTLPPKQLYATAQDAGQNVATAYSALMAFSTACLNAAPAAMDAWRLKAAG
jgi:hypothetical protein